MSDGNRTVIDEFRANHGRVGGNFEGKPLLLLHHEGAKTGIERVNPLMYQTVDGSYAVFASKGGADDDPDWLHNLKANPRTTIEVGDRTIQVMARIAEGEEHDRVWSKQKSDYEFFAAYERKTARDRIPVVILDPV